MKIISKKMKNKCIKCKNRGQAWFHSPKDFHCPICKDIGYVSIYGDGCTRCSNNRRILSNEIT